MVNYLKKVLYIIPASPGSLLRIVALFLLVSNLEAIGIGVVGLFLNLATDPNIIHENEFIKFAFLKSGVASESRFIMILSAPVIIVFCARSYLSWLSQVYINRFGNRQQRLLIVRMIHEFLGANYTFHTKKNSSSIVESIIEIANALTSAIVNPLLTSISNMFVIISLLVLLFYTSITMMVVILLALLPIFLIFNSFKGRLAQWGKLTRNSKENIVKIINHTFGSIKETKTIGCESYFESQLLEQVSKLEESHNNFAAFKIMPRFVLEGTLVSCVIVITCIHLFLTDGVNGDLTSVLGIYGLASIRLLPAISNLLGGVSVLRSSTYTVNQIYSELSELKRVHDSSVQVADEKRVLPSSCGPLTSNRSSIMRFERQIELSGVTYYYPDSLSPAISSLSITIAKGESVAFVGKSGAGKTTLVDIILGLLVPQEGDLRVDDISVYGNLRAWQDLIAYIPQSIFLMDDTIERNVAFGVPDSEIDRGSLKRAIEVAQLTEVIEGLPDGLDTKVGERGILLSGGQRQRVGIARALYHEREILVLDEATSALDNETEKHITNAINSLGGRKTLIIIAHRLTTVEKCNKVHLMHDGKLVKSGSYGQVVLGGR